MRNMREPRGVSAVVTAILLVVLGGFLALALNVGHLFSVRGELQNGVDASALAAAKDLNGRDTGPLEATLGMAQDFATRHKTDGQHDVTPAEGDVLLVEWDHSARRVIASYVLPGALDAAKANVNFVNGVWVKARRDAAAPGGSIETAFRNAFLFKDSTNVGAQAIAVNGPACMVGCMELPVALAHCGIVSQVMSGSACGAEFRIYFSDDKNDTGAWTTLQGTAGGGANTIMDLLAAIEARILTNADPCSTVPLFDDKGKVLPSTSAVDVPEEIWVDNGVANSVCESASDLWEALKDVDADRVLTVPVVQGVCTDCTKSTDPKCRSIDFVQTPPVVGFASIRMAAAPVCAGDDPGQKYLTFELLCGQKAPNSSGVGCGNFGTWSDHAQLVK